LAAARQERVTPPEVTEDAAPTAEALLEELEEAASAIAAVEEPRQPRDPGEISCRMCKQRPCRNGPKCRAPLATGSPAASPAVSPAVGIEGTD